MSKSQVPPQVWRAKPVSWAMAALTAATLTVSTPPAQAQQGLPIIRDAETEQLLREYTTQIFKAAGLSRQDVRIVIINDRSFNAFVADGRRIFVNVGALTQAKTPNEVIGVLAHESGHLAGGHLARMREELSRAQTSAIVAMLLGLGAAAAGATMGGTSGVNAGQIGMAGIAGPQSLMMNTLLYYQRGLEEQADKAGVKFLTAAGESPKGMYETFKRFADDQLVQAHNINPYLQSHPMPKERIAALELLVKSSPYWDKKDPPALQERHNQMRAKLSGFLERPDAVMRRYPPSDTSLPARYARAIATYRASGVRAAIPLIEGLIQSDPHNPYFYELMGQSLLENGHAAEAVAPLRRAHELAPNAHLISIMYAEALIATNDTKAAAEAIPLLRVAVNREPEMPDGFSQLALAYGHKGDYADADLASAQAALARGDVKTARELAARAKTQFPTGSPGWVRADDIVSTKPSASN
jgi:predicted Zn-dependent protease